MGRAPWICGGDVPPGGSLVWSPQKTVGLQYHLPRREVSHASLVRSNPLKPFPGRFLWLEAHFNHFLVTLAKLLDFL